MLKQAAVAVLSLAMFPSLSAVATPDETVLLKKGAVEITASEYGRMTRFVLNDEQRVQLFSNEQRLRELLADYYITHALAAEAVEMGLDQDESFKFHQHYNELRQLAQRRIQALESEQRVPDYRALARETYLTQRENFRVPEQVSVEHILVSVTDERSEAEALERIKEVESKLRAGEDFSALALEYSDDPSVPNNRGKLGYFSKGQMVKPFEETAFAMTSPGELSGPVKTDFGYHILRFVGRMESHLRSFEDVEGQLVEQERQRFINALRNNKIEAIRTAKDIEVNQEAVKAFFLEGQQALERAD